MSLKIAVALALLCNSLLTAMEPERTCRDIKLHMNRQWTNEKFGSESLKNEAIALVLKAREGLDISKEDSTKEFQFSFQEFDKIPGIKHLRSQAVCHGCINWVKFYLNHGGNVNGYIEWKITSDSGSSEFNIVGKNMLHVAVEKQCCDIVALLCRHNADVNTQAYFESFFCTPLHLALSKHAVFSDASEKIIKTLLLHGADLFILSSDNETPLDILQTIWKRNSIIVKGDAVSIPRGLQECLWLATYVPNIASLVRLFLN